MACRNKGERGRVGASCEVRNSLNIEGSNHCKRMVVTVVLVRAGSEVNNKRERDVLPGNTGTLVLTRAGRTRTMLVHVEDEQVA